MRIGISGASNCGKTTLANDLASALDFEVIPEYLGEPFGILEKRPPSDLFIRLKDIARAKQSREAQLTAGFISDRSPVDLAIHCYNSRLHEVFPDQCKTFIDECRTWAQTYDVIIFPPGPSPVVGSENYYGNPAKLWRIWQNHNLMMGLALRWVGIERLRLIPDSEKKPEARVDWVIANCGLAPVGQNV